MRRVNPLGVLVRGTLAGAAGSWLQNRFFTATGSIAPGLPVPVFEPPEPEQRDETATQTVARRFVEQLMHRPRLSPEEKKRSATVVHYAFGSGWGALYGLAAESVVGLRSEPGALLFGAGVWMASDNGILPVFRLAAPPARYPAKTHAYALAAHFAYGLGVHATYELLRGPRLLAGAALAAALVAHRRDRRQRVRERLQRAARSFAGAPQRESAQVH